MNLNIEILGTKLDAIHKAEDRDLFRTLMNELGEPVPESDIIHNLEEAIHSSRESVIRLLFALHSRLVEQAAEFVKMKKNS